MSGLKMKIIVLNGAPFTGKDTLAKRLCDLIPDAVPFRFKDVLYRRMSEKYNLDFDIVVELCNDVIKKDQPSELLDGKIPRQELIFISEEEIKKGPYGEDGVAVATIENLLEVEDYGRKTFVFSDGGFTNEVDCLKRLLRKFGLVELVIIRITKEGCTFINDSRHHIDNPTYIINNDIVESGGNVGDHMLSQLEPLLNS